MNPLLGIFAAPAATSALDLAGKVIEGAAEPFAAALEAAMQCCDQPSANDSLDFLEEAATSSDNSGGLIDLDGLFAALGL